MKIAFFLFAINVFVISCHSLKNEDIRNSDPDIPRNQVFDYSFSVKTAAKYYIENISETDIELEIDDKKIERSSKLESAIILEPLQDSSNILIRVSYEKIIITTQDQEGDEVIVDADHATKAFNTVDNILGIIKDAPFYISLDSNGNVVKVSGTQEIINKVLNEVASRAKDSETKIKELVEQLVGESYIKSSFNQNFKIFPDTSVHIGSKWSKEYEESATINFISKNNYEVTKLNDEIVALKFKGDIKSGSIPASLMGTNVQTKITGTQTGKMEFDRASGMMIKSSSTTEIEGTVEVMGKVIPLNIEIKKSTTTRKF